MTIPHKHAIICRKSAESWKNVKSGLNAAFSGKLRLLNQEEKAMVKSTGIVRKVDELGRIVIPIELRRTLDIGIKDSLEIYVEDDQIILKKYMPACAFCSNASGITIFKGKNICSECLAELSKLS